MKKTFFKKIIATSFISLFFVQMLYLTVEPTVVGAVDAVDTGGVLVTLNVTQEISLTPGADATMAPNIGISSDHSIGSSAWTVKTNSVTGYNLTVTSGTTPALKNGSTDNFADYTEASVPETWSIGAGAKEFGFSAYGTDANSLTKYGSPANCGTAGVPNASGKYEGFSGSTPITIASKSTITPVAGVVTNICFAAEQNGTYAISGSYTATITATATTI